MKQNSYNCPYCGYQFKKQELWMKNSISCPICNCYVVKSFRKLPIILLIFMDCFIVRFFGKGPNSIMFLLIGSILATICRVLILCCFPLMNKLSISYLKKTK